MAFRFPGLLRGNSSDFQGTWTWDVVGEQRVTHTKIIFTLPNGLEKWQRMAIEMAYRKHFLVSFKKWGKKGQNCVSSVQTFPCRYYDILALVDCIYSALSVFSPWYLCGYIHVDRDSENINCSAAVAECTFVRAAPLLFISLFSFSLFFFSFFFAICRTKLQCTITYAVV